MRLLCPLILCRLAVFALTSHAAMGVAAEWQIPRRPDNAEGGSVVAARVAALSLAERESVFVAEILKGNVPAGLRQMVKVEVRTVQATSGTLALDACPNYLMIGSDTDYFLAPLSPESAEKIATATGCILPRPDIVDAIWKAAKRKLPPRPMAPGPEMTSVAAFLRHQAIVQTQMGNGGLEILTAGHKKDVVWMPPAKSLLGKVTIYGWHRENGQPIQPLYSGHTSQWVDYSHGIRLLSNDALLDGKLVKLRDIYGSKIFKPQPKDPDPASKPYRIEELMPGVRVGFDCPAVDATKPLHLVIYAAPNGNSVEETFGGTPATAAEWRCDIQHIAAQARWVRKRQLGEELIVACIEAEGKSWPAWIKEHGADGKSAAKVVTLLKAEFPGRQIRLTLASHSGGGSFVFGCLDDWEAIPPEIRRIAFLDSNYGYNSTRSHDVKIAEWLKADPARHLCVLAYHDSVALYQGKTFVSENGGTWGRTLAMQQDFQKHWELTTTDDGTWRESRGLDGQLLLRMRHNPDKAVLHTRLVEWNGFIHALLCGTPLESKDYAHGGQRVYQFLVRKN